MRVLDRIKAMAGARAKIGARGGDEYRGLSTALRFGRDDELGWRSRFPGGMTERKAAANTRGSPLRKPKTRAGYTGRAFELRFWVGSGLGFREAS